MSEQGTRNAYGDRAEEYARLLGSVDRMAAEDRRRIETWAARTDGVSCGLLLDLGCGPGHWTAHLASRGHRVRGIDPVPGFIELAHDTHPGVAFSVGDVFAPAIGEPTCSGVLAWYSLIHLEPARMRAALASIVRMLRPGGTLLLGFFDGARLEPFDHVIATAHYWPVSQLESLLEDVGLTVTDVEQRTDPGARPHGAIEARRELRS